MERSILHVDMDAFYASVEVLDDPSLRGRPVVVAGAPGGRGVVSSASYEARRFGVRAAMPSGQAAQLCPQAVFVAPRMARYAEVSHQLFAIFRDFSPLVEGLSIDEAFLDLTGSARLLGPAPEVAARLQRRIRDELGLGASIGVAPNKFLAKVGSEMEKPEGLVVFTAEDAAARIADLPVRALLGIGEVAARKLRRLGLHRVRHVQQASLALLQAAVGTQAAGLQRLAMGLDERPVEPGGRARSVGAERTFARDLGDPGELVRQLDELAEEAATRLRKEGLRARTVGIKVRFPDFTTLTRARTLPRPEDRTDAIRRVARELLEQKVERRGRPLRLLGVTLSGLGEVHLEQATLFPDPGEQEARRLDATVDRIRASFGEGALTRGSRLKRRRE